MLKDVILIFFLLHLVERKQPNETQTLTTLVSKDKL